MGSSVDGFAWEDTGQTLKVGFKIHPLDIGRATANAKRPHPWETTRPEYRWEGR